MLNLNKMISDLMQEVIAYEGVDKEMQNFVAQDRNDVIRAKELYYDNNIAELKSHVDYLDTIIREGVVMAFAADISNDWVRENLGWELR